MPEGAAVLLAALWAAPAGGLAVFAPHDAAWALFSLHMAPLHVIIACLAISVRLARALH